MHRLTGALVATLLVSSSFLATGATAATFDEAQTKAVQEIVRDYLVKNPEVIMEALDVLDQRQKEAEQVASQQLMANRQKELFQDPNSVIAGNPEAKFLIVEFFDYQCGYCKMAHDSVKSILNENKDIGVVLKEFPILGATSTLASKAAIASRKQGKYLELHDALLSDKGQLNEARIFQLAQSVGIDTEQLRKDMEAPEIEQILQANHALALGLNIQGTPGFIVGKEVVRGFLPAPQMKELIERESKASRS